MDSVITSVGYGSSPLVNETNEHIPVIGDASKVGNLPAAVWVAYDNTAISKEDMAVF